MRALFIGLLAATLVGCTTAPEPSARKQLVSTVGTKNVKSIKPKKTKAVAKVTRTGTTTPSPATQFTRADPVTEKAKAAIAAMLEDPASAQFYNLKRAQKKLLHMTLDTICGYVKAKDGPGGGIREMPFLYTVSDGEAYLVNGRSQVAETVHGSLCK
jgi:hypothetical protein